MLNYTGTVTIDEISFFFFFIIWDVDMKLMRCEVRQFRQNNLEYDLGYAEKKIKSLFLVERASSCTVCMVMFTHLIMRPCSEA